MNRKRKEASLWLGVAVCLGMLGAPAQTSAQAEEDTDQSARMLFQQGDAAYAEGRYEAAVQLFDEAYRLSARPVLLFNIANALERMGRWGDAADYLNRYLPEASDGERRTVKRRIRALRARAAAIDKQDSKRGVPVHAETPKSKVRPAKLVGVLLTSVAGVAVASSVAFGLLARGANQAADDDCEFARRLCSEAAASDLERADSFALVTDVSIGAAVAMGVGGMIALLLDRSGRAERARAARALRPWATLQGGGLTVAGEF